MPRFFFPPRYPFAVTKMQLLPMPKTELSRDVISRRTPGSPPPEQTIPMPRMAGAFSVRNTRDLPDPEPIVTYRRDVPEAALFSSVA